ncbi:MAG TPA: tetraacyldisaccharide 4'-kinase [Pyrinomonadaceae bacterium]|jgi:tetraacyldisaccharide 4'-kinase|nr:tetraacyldisaccharide 4'-kinase [Pyrinomonadaceae bacterium]
MPIPLAPLGLLYGALVRARLRLYRSGFLKTESVGVPVISVGNITAGGTGKTPLVEWVARAVAREGRRACVLTRGYGRADERRLVVASDGERVLAETRECGDEPRLLAEKLLGAASVVCDRDRVAAARWARTNLGAQVFVLDDGFQHLRIARDLDIVTLDATAPWGGGHMLPRGRLRESPAALARAGCIVITRAELAGDLEGLRAEAVRLSGGRACVITSRVRTRGLAPLNAPTARLPLGALTKEPAAAFCAVGNPHAFFEHLRRAGFDLRHTRAFPDHHAYTQADVEAFTREAVGEDARALLTTAKDAVKLRGCGFTLPCYVIETELEFEDEGSLLGLIRGALSASC